MPDLLLAPYLPLRERVSVGPWELVPFKLLAEADVVPGEFSRAVMRLVDAYRLPSGGGQSLGAVIFPRGGHVGSDFERSALPPLRRALLAGVVANNPFMAVDEDDQDPNAGHAVGTAENALVWGHPIGDGDSYVIETGVLARAISYSSAPSDEPLPSIAPPRELPTNLFGGFDVEVADAAHVVMVSGTAVARRVFRALDWYLIAFANSEAVTPDVRIGAARSALEVLTGAGDASKKIVRAVGRLLSDDGTPTKPYRSPIWTRHGAEVPVQLTASEWWLARLCELRNAIVHGDEVEDDRWMHEGQHHLNHAHDRLIECLLAMLAIETDEPLLRLRGSERMRAQRAEEFARLLREAQDRERGSEPRA